MEKIITFTLALIIFNCEPMADKITPYSKNTIYHAVKSFNKLDKSGYYYFFCSEKLAENNTILTVCYSKNTINENIGYSSIDEYKFYISSNDSLYNNFKFTPDNDCRYFFIVNDKEHQILYSIDKLSISPIRDNFEHYKKYEKEQFDSLETEEFY
jgi:hypothetical protein